LESYRIEHKIVTLRNAAESTSSVCIRVHTDGVSACQTVSGSAARELSLELTPRNGIGEN